MQSPISNAMKKNLPLPVLLFTLGFNVVFGQWTLAERNAKKAFEDHFAPPRETLFLHLNKSSYVIGEEIWFKAYAYNRQKGLPFKETTNLYVGLYDSIGRQVTKKLFRASDGHSSGNIKLDSTFVAGNYYFKASTNWMRNFSGKGSFVQKIKVFGQDALVTAPKQKNMAFDVQFLPEGGKLIAGIQNNIGIKCIGQDGLGAQIIEGSIQDSKGNKVATFKVPPSGMASLTLKPEQEMQYSASVTFEGGKQGTYLLPRPVEEGYNIHLQDVDERRLLIVFGRGQLTKKKGAKEKLVLWVSKDGLAKKLDVNFGKKEDYTSQVVDKSALYNGMNVLTLLNTEGRPILERLYYNHQVSDTDAIEIVGTDMEKDSIAITIAGRDNNKTLLNLSVSVLPQQTMAYEHQDNILSTFLLSPYIKGHVENPAYYFKDVTPKKMKELDLLLLIQGWSSYDWNEIYAGPLEKNFAFEQGMELFGRVNFKLKKGDKLMVYPFRGFQGRIIDMDPNRPEFNIKGLFPEKGKTIKFSLINDYGKVIKPKMFVSTKGKWSEDRLARLWETPIYKNTLSNRELPQPIDFLKPDNTIELEEVTLVDERIQKKFFTPFIPENKLTKVTKRIANSYPNMLEIIRTNGFYVYIHYDPGDTKVKISSRRPVSMNAVQNESSNFPPLIYIDDVRLWDTDRLLYDYPLTEVDSYFIDKAGDGEGGGGSGVIRIYTKDYNQIDENSPSTSAEEKIFSYPVKNGFEPNKRFYIPKYKVFGEAFKKFGAIHWEPSLVIDKKGNATLKVLNTGTQELTLFIEGMGDDGKLVSSMKTIAINNQDSP